MSFFIKTEILCDVPGCGESIEGACGHCVRRVTANITAIREGWKMKANDQHVCPEHRDEVP